jgi:hypothetical protein
MALFQKKKKIVMEEGREDEEVEARGEKSAEERHEDKKGDAKGKISGGFGKGKKMSEAKMKLHKKLSMRLATSKGKVY